MVLGKKHHHEPTPQEIIDYEAEANLRAHTLSEENNPAVYGVVPFDTRVLDDEKILRYFDEESSMYDGCYKPLMPFASRLLATILLTDREVQLFCLDVDIAAEESHTLASTDEQHYMIESIASHVKWRITGAARKGFLLRTITENRKILRYVQEGEGKKKPWWKVW